MTPIAQALPEAPPPPRTNARWLMNGILANRKVETDWDNLLICLADQQVETLKLDIPGGDGRVLLLAVAHVLDKGKKRSQEHPNYSPARSQLRQGELRNPWSTCLGKVRRPKA
jgi:hypothetical protein